MSQHERIKALIVAVQAGKKIETYKAARALLRGDSEPTQARHVLSLELKEACELVRSVWLDLEDRPAYIAGMFAPETFMRAEEQDDGKKEKPEAQPKERNEDPVYGCAGREAERTFHSYGQSLFVSSTNDEAEQEEGEGL